MKTHRHHNLKIAELKKKDISTLLIQLYLSTRGRTTYQISKRICIGAERQSQNDPPMNMWKLKRKSEKNRTKYYGNKKFL